MDINVNFSISALLQVSAVLLQATAAIYALKLTRLTGRQTSWFLISGALVIMAARRSFSLWQLFSGARLAAGLWDEAVAAVISALMFAGVLSIAPLLQNIKAAAEALRRSRDELEVQVAARTEELQDANTRLAVELDERRRTEQRLAQYAGDLARSNAELEQFAYVASHDLQEPLRMVASFTQLLAKRYQGKLDQEADEFIGYAVEGARRMQQLINDLLAFSRVGTRGKPLKPTALDHLLDQALANLGPAIEESRAEITREPLPTIPGDEVQLLQLFQNLLANGIKFRGQVPPRLHVSAAPQDGEWVCAVRDNGIGIAPEHQERIFQIFQRLHARSEYPGTGLGLALCRKIVERHGGRIWVESQPGQGSTFYFSLPGGKEQ